MNTRHTVFAVILFAATATSGHAQWLNIDTLLPDGLSAGSSSTQFGKTVAVDRETDGSVRALYVGAPGASVTYGNTTYAGAGKVYVLSPTGGWHVADYIYGPPEVNAHFGAALAVSHGVIAVGIPDRDCTAGANCGRVEIYEDLNAGDSSLEPQLDSYTLFASSSAGDHFGDSVALDGYGLDAGSGGMFLAAGAPGKSSQKGCIYAYHLGLGYTNTEGIACGATAGDSLGASVSIRASSSTFFVMVAGAPGVTQGDQQLAGATYVYVPHVPQDQNLQLLDTFAAQNPAFLDAFGTAVAQDATRIYVAGTGRNKSGTGRTGSVSVFEPSGFIGYSFATELFPDSSGSAGDLCGAALSAELTVSGRIAMGCPSHDGLVTNEGAVRVLTLGSLLGNPHWFQNRVDMSDLPHGADDLGRGVVLVGDYLYAGAPNYDGAFGANNGAVRVFAIDTIFKDGFGN